MHLEKKIEKLTEELVLKLKNKNITLAGAESCTGGLVSAYITSVSGASAVFQGALITYTHEIKEEILKVQK